MYVKLIKVGGLVLKKMVGVIIDVDDSAMRILIQNLQVLQLVNVGENVGTVVSFLKGALMLIKNCALLLADTTVLMNDTM